MQSTRNPARDREPKGLQFDRRGLVSSKSQTFMFGIGVDAIPVFVHQGQSQDGLNWKITRARIQREARREAAK